MSKRTSSLFSELGVSYLKITKYKIGVSYLQKKQTFICQCSTKPAYTTYLFTLLLNEKISIT